jgi:hypothetical protein
VLLMLLLPPEMAKQRRYYGHQSCGKHQEKLSEILKIGGNIRGKTSIGRVVDDMYDGASSSCYWENMKKKASRISIFSSAFILHHESDKR